MPAKSAVPCADIAEDHERGRAGIPAFAQVRALGRLADGVQAVAIDQVQQLAVVLAAGHLHLQPRGLADDAGRDGFEDFQGQGHLSWGL